MADIPATRYVKSDDVHVAYQVIVTARYTCSGPRLFCLNMEASLLPVGRARLKQSR